MSEQFDCANQTVYPLRFCEVYGESACSQMNEAVAITPKFTAMLSMIGVSLIIFRFFNMNKRSRKTYDRLLLGMSIMNFWGSLGFFFGQWTFPTIAAGDASSPFCNWQGWLLQINAAVYWYNAILATNFVLRIRFGWTEDRVRKWEPLMHTVAWFIPVVTSFVALGLNMYGKAGPWCWIMVSYDWARWAFFFAWLWFLMIYSTICMVLIVITVKRSDDQTAHIRESQTSGSGKNKRKRLGRKTREVAIQATLYVATFLLTWIFGTANRIQNAVVYSDPSVAQCNVFALTWLHSFFVPLQGFFNFLVYIYPRIKESKRKSAARIRDHPRPKEEESNIFKQAWQVVSDVFIQGFTVIFGREYRSESRDSAGKNLSQRNANNPSQNPSGEIPSEPKTQDDNEESNSDQNNKAGGAGAQAKSPRTIDMMASNGTAAQTVEAEISPAVTSNGSTPTIVSVPVDQTTGSAATTTKDLALQ